MGCHCLLYKYLLLFPKQATLLRSSFPTFVQSSAASLSSIAISSLRLFSLPALATGWPSLGPRLIAQPPASLSPWGCLVKISHAHNPHFLSINTCTDVPTQPIKCLCTYTHAHIYYFSLPFTKLQAPQNQKVDIIYLRFN